MTSGATFVLPQDATKCTKPLGVLPSRSQATKVSFILARYQMALTALTQSPFKENQCIFFPSFQFSCIKASSPPAGKERGFNHIIPLNMLLPILGKPPLFRQSWTHQAIKVSPHPATLFLTLGCWDPHITKGLSTDSQSCPSSTYTWFASLAPVLFPLERQAADLVQMLHVTLQLRRKDKRESVWLWIYIFRLFCEWTRAMICNAFFLTCYHHNSQVCAVVLSL